MSLIGSLIGFVVGKEYVGLLGFVPIYLGIKGFIGLMKREEENESIPTNSGKNRILTVASVTFANGGDNIGIYVQFATIAWTEKITMVIVFLAMTFVWCYGAKYFTTHRYVANLIGKYSHWVTPFVLVLLGVYSLYESGSWRLL